MGAAFFYHLTRQSVDQAMSMLLPKCLEQDWRVLVRGTDAKGLGRLDKALWTMDPDSFLPHAMAGGAHDDMQPILLAIEGVEVEHDCLMAVQSAAVTSDEVSARQRTMILFEAADDAQMANARAQWKALTDAGCSAQYWSQESGRWAKKAEKN
ncbi:MAG: DNA polymerase III subunit chi [Planktomarina sp.]